uniref:Diaminobutyrate--2-oxoglutarate transaminase n=1 Tax=Candidatus Kentrum sp. DK TaxID=2126562 RepID=A0A450SSQ9_9GAMM|nr:MAG: diaminobutyrate aminotransferase apoenzyme [Candidatus Kentron sp. DK]VFJ57509.1 MAG: diaminobutyrate aminotransferase apoenzyme [Candidatus Kentron sp. DK]
MDIFESIESNVRSYMRSFPAVFDTARGAYLFDEDGNRYIDFFAGAGTLNYGHNNPLIKKALMRYLERDGIMHGLDKATVAKRAFLEKFQSTVLEPRGMAYKVQFTGPTGTNAVEAALKLAHIVKKRSSVIAFTNGFHGMTMGSLALTGNDFYRSKYYGMQSDVNTFPFDGYLGPDTNTIDQLHKFMSDSGSGMDLPAAVITETVQGEGGVNIASPEWLRDLSQLCREFGILLIIDDIQVGNGRTGTFFSFERAGIQPDMITLSKSLGGGLPMAIVLMRPELDQWQPGEHTGTFRGNNLAFVAATELLSYWDSDEFPKSIVRKGKIMEGELKRIAAQYPEPEMKVRGLGMIWGLEFSREGFAKEVSAKAFEKGLIIETAGAANQLVKFLPSLTIEEDVLQEGLRIIDDTIAGLLREKKAEGDAS